MHSLTNIYKENDNAKSGMSTTCLILSDGNWTKSKSVARAEYSLLYTGIEIFSCTTCLKRSDQLRVQ